MSIEVLAVEPDWQDDYASEPDLRLLVRGYERVRDDAVYEKRPIPTRERGDWHIYWTRQDDFVRFFSWGGKPDSGYAGYRRTVRLADGTEEEVIGGWHCAPGAAVAAGFPETVDVTLVRDSHVRIGSPWFCTSGVPAFVIADRLRAEVERLRPDLEVIPSPYNTLTVKWRGRPSKAEWIAEASRDDAYSALGPATEVAR